MNLQPLGICMSYQQTREIVKLVAQDYDVEVQEWADELKKSITIYSHYSDITAGYITIHSSSELTGVDTLHNLSAKDIFGTSDDEADDDDSEELTGQLGRDEYSDVEGELDSSESLDGVMLQRLS